VIVVTGAAGFVGQRVVRELTNAGHFVRAVMSDAKRARAFEGVDLELAVADVTDPGSLGDAMADAETVVHLVAIITGPARRIEHVIGEGTANVVAAARAGGASRIVHMSALGVSAETKDAVPYYRGKWTAEAAVAGSGLAQTILRPSFVFGLEGGALPRFVRIARLAPVTPIVGSGRQRLQPIWVDDLARAVRLAVERDESGTVEVGGPDVVDWNALWAAIKEALGTRRPSLHVPRWLMRAPALALELLPDPPVTRDQLTMLGLGDNVVGDDGESMRQLGLDDLVPLSEQLRRATEAATA
jgi:uncharacterized protein YbjT (DUF2867 family)